MSSPEAILLEQQHDKFVTEPKTLIEDIVIERTVSNDDNISNNKGIFCGSDKQENVTIEKIDKLIDGFIDQHITTKDIKMINKLLDIRSRIKEIR